MTRFSLAVIATAILVTTAAATGAEGQGEIDLESADDITLALSKLPIETRTDEITPEAYRAAKTAVMDALGCAMAGDQASGVPAVVDVTKEWGEREEATLWFHGGKVPGPAATFVNSVQTHALDLDDYHKPSSTHITSVIVPATFAMGELHHASGNRQALFDRTLTKRIQPAIAARAGAFASYLAREGFTGPRRIIAGQPASLVPIYGLSREGPQSTVGRVMEPHDFFEIEQLAYKRYASCGASHYAIQSALDLANEHDLKLADIERTEIYGCNWGLTGVPWRDSDSPQAMAQFCAPYEVASVIKNRRFGPAEITPERIAEDREVDAMARRCELCDWKRWGGPQPALQAVRILLKDGRKFEAWHNQEEVLSPTSNTYEQLVKKFKYNVTFSGLLDDSQAQEMVEAIEKLDQCKSIEEFIKRYLVFKQ